mmetsp:Transcript_6664/g.16307  ORF Transcript_6664/g.16307 Transcript_6664/m.16307 type:complete len:253 (+) Transcript_6664:159-917(+)
MCPIWHRRHHLSGHQTPDCCYSGRRKRPKWHWPRWTAELHQYPGKATRLVPRHPTEHRSSSGHDLPLPLANCWDHLETRSQSLLTWLHPHLHLEMPSHQQAHHQEGLRLPKDANWVQMHRPGRCWWTLRRCPISHQPWVRHLLPLAKRANWLQAYFPEWCYSKQQMCPILHQPRWPATSHLQPGCCHSTELRCPISHRLHLPAPRSRQSLYGRALASPLAKHHGYLLRMASLTQLYPHCCLHWETPRACHLQ